MLRRAYLPPPCRCAALEILYREAAQTSSGREKYRAKNIGFFMRMQFFGMFPEKQGILFLYPPGADWISQNF